MQVVEGDPCTQGRRSKERKYEKEVKIRVSGSELTNRNQPVICENMEMKIQLLTVSLEAKRYVTASHS